MKKLIVLVFMFTLFSSVIYGLKKPLITHCINKYYLSELNIKAENLKTIGLNKITFAKVYYKDTLLDYGKIGFQFKEVDIYFDLYDLLFKQKIQHIEFKEPDIKFYDIALKDFLYQDQLYSFITKNSRVSFKNTIGFMYFNNPDKIVLSLRDYKSGKVFLKTIFTNNYEISEIDFNSNSSKIVNMKDSVIFYPLEEDGFCDLEFTFLKQNKGYDLKIKKCTINTSPYYLASQLKFKRTYDNKKVIDNFSSHFSNKFLSCLLKIARQNKKLEVKATIERLASKLFAKGLGLTFDIDVVDDNTKSIKGVFGEDKRIYFEGSFSKTELNINIVIKEVLRTKHNISANLKVIKQDGVLIFTFKDIFIGSRRMPNIELLVSVKENMLIIKTIKWGENLVLGQGQIYTNKASYIELDLDLNGLDIALIKPFMPHAMAEVISGILSGNLSFKGDIFSPECKGNIKIKDGILDDVKFKNLEAAFMKKENLIKLEGAKIFRNADVLLLEGTMDLNKDDVFENVTVTTRGNTMEWDGWHIGQTAAEDEFKLEKKVGENVTIAFKNTVNKDTSNVNELDASLELNYDMTRTDKLMLKMEDDDSFVGYKKQYDF